MAKVKFTRKQWGFIREALRYQHEAFETDYGEILDGCEKISRESDRITDKIDLILKTTLK